MEYKNKNNSEPASYSIYHSFLIFFLALFLSACSTGGDDDAVAEKATVQMPVVVGLDEGVAVTNLEALDLTINIVRVPHNSPVGEVNDQDPVAGEIIEVESTVTITVSDGVSVPDVVGLSETEASQVLNDTGLLPAISYANDNELIGTVISQATNALSQVDPGTTIGITVSSGVAVPDVLGMNFTDASSTLVNLGFIVEQNRISNGAAIDTVINQDYTLGSSLNFGSTITLTVSNGITIPNLVGQNYQDVEIVLNNMGLNTAISRLNDTSEIDSVFNQSPAAGTNVLGGTVVTLFVSDGVQVPNVVGITITEANSTLAQAGFTVAENHIPDLAPIGEVISQNPLQGVNLNSGSQVTINVSSGVVVPDVVGSMSSVGESQLTNAGLTVSIVTVNSIEPIGQILSQNIPAGSSENAGTEIQITVSDGLTVPPVTGMDIAEATADLEGLGFSVSINNVIDNSQTDGQVFEQDPAAGIQTNGAVQVTLSVYVTNEIVLGPTDCLTNQTNIDFVNQIAAVNPADGGQLYDKWWSAAGAAEPVSNHPLWAVQDTNTRIGADTWRCKECHGWDYAGNDGVYGDTSNTHYTGFPGILPAAGADAINVFCAIKVGSNIDERHNFSNQISDANILRLTRFITESQLGSMPRGILDTSDHISASGTITNASHTNGEAIYPTVGCANVGCHSAVDQFPETEMANLALDNPWETLHKVRFGHPGSAMPAFSDPASSLPMTLAQSKDVLAHVQTIGVISPATCATDFAPLVAQIDFADAAQGGQLYDTWWIAAGVAEPTSDHPLWSTRSQPAINTRTGADTWRCKECHGWDYGGADGVYGDTANSHYTGFPSLQTAATREPLDVFCRIRAGAGVNPAHNFATVMSDIQILHLTKFITASQAGTMPLGLINTSSLIASNGSTIGTNATNGNSLYTSQGCGSSNCHGLDGDVQHEWLGELASDDPWGTLHKIRFGHPGSSPVMPSFIDTIMLSQANDIVAYAQTLPLPPAGGGGGGTPPLLSDAATIAMGGRLYDNWITETGSDAPPIENPVWALQDSNNRTGAATWRCKECHGWDYKGADGVYGDASNSHFTGFGGVLNTEKTEEEIVIYLTEGFFYAPALENVHSFDGLLTAEQIQALAAFIKQGTVDTDPYFGMDTIINGSLQNFLNGEFLYLDQPNGPFNGICNICHEADGRGEFGVVLGNLANTNPWEFLHKIRFGQPATAMPSMFDAINSSGGPAYTIQDAVDIIQYSQSLPQQ